MLSRKSWLLYIVFGVYILAQCYVIATREPEDPVKAFSAQEKTQVDGATAQSSSSTAGKTSNAPNVVLGCTEELTAYNQTVYAYRDALSKSNASAMNAMSYAQFVQYSADMENQYDAFTSRLNAVSWCIDSKLQEIDGDNFIKRTLKSHDRDRLERAFAYVKSISSILEGMMVDLDINFRAKRLEIGSVDLLREQADIDAHTLRELVRLDAWKTGIEQAGGKVNKYYLEYYLKLKKFAGIIQRNPVIFKDTQQSQESESKKSQRQPFIPSDVLPQITDDEDIQQRLDRFQKNIEDLRG
jgi:hypothetical protein